MAVKNGFAAHALAVHVLLGVLVGAASGYAIGHVIPPTHVSTATLYVAPPISSTPSDAVLGDQYADSRTQLYLQLAQSDAVASLAAAALQTADSPEAVRSRVEVRGSHEAPLITIRASGTSAQAAEALAQAYVDQLPKYARSVEENSGLREGPVLLPVAGPSSAAMEAGPSPWTAAAIGAAVGALTALLFSWWRNRRRPVVRSAGDIRRVSPSSVIFSVRRVPADMLRLRALILSEATSRGKVLLAGSRHRDDIAGFTAEFMTLLDESRVANRLVPTNSIATFRDGHENSGLTVFAIPALLDQPPLMLPPAALSSVAVVAVRPSVTLVSDYTEVAKWLEINGIRVLAVVMLRKRTRRGNTGRRSDRNTGMGDPWPIIDVLEAEMTRRGKSVARHD